jgi:hypothetical protein
MQYFPCLYLNLGFLSFIFYCDILAYQYVKDFFILEVDGKENAEKTVEGQAVKKGVLFQYLNGFVSLVVL